MSNRARNGRNQSGRFDYYTHIVKAVGSQDGARKFFKSDGTLTATVSDSVGDMTYLRLGSTAVGQINVRVYGQHGTTGVDPDKYTLIFLQPAQATLPNVAMDNVWEMPEGMRCTGIMVVTDPGAGKTVTISAGR